MLVVPHKPCHSRWVRSPRCDSCAGTARCAARPREGSGGLRQARSWRRSAGSGSPGAFLKTKSEIGNRKSEACELVSDFVLRISDFARLWFRAGGHKLGTLDDLVIHGHRLTKRLGWNLDLLNQADQAQQLDEIVGHVELPPAEAVARRAWVSMMIIVPAFAQGEQGDPPEVRGAIPGRIAAVAPPVGSAVDQPGRVVEQRGTHENPPDKP